MSINAYLASSTFQFTPFCLRHTFLVRYRSVTLYYYCMYLYIQVHYTVSLRVFMHTGHYTVVLLLHVFIHTGTLPCKIACIYACLHEFMHSCMYVCMYSCMSNSTPMVQKKRVYRYKKRVYRYKKHVY